MTCIISHEQIWIWWWLVMVGILLIESFAIRHHNIIEYRLEWYASFAWLKHNINNLFHAMDGYSRTWIETYNHDSCQSIKSINAIDVRLAHLVWDWTHFGVCDQRQSMSHSILCSYNSLIIMVLSFSAHPHVQACMYGAFEWCMYTKCYVSVV